jgi:hypothetical protein
MFVQLLKEFTGRKVGERIDVSEADANALVAQQIAHPVSEDLITPAIQKAMEQAFAGFQNGLDAVINAQLTAFQTAQAKSRRNAVPIIFGEGGDGGCGTNRATTAATGRPTRSALPLRRRCAAPCVWGMRPIPGWDFSAPQSIDDPDDPQKPSLGRACSG